MNIGQAAAAANVTANRLAKERIVELGQKVVELQSMVDTLKHLSYKCSGDARPDCPIIARFEGEPS